MSSSDLIQATLTVANESLMQANSTAVQAGTVISQKRADADAAVVLSNSVKLNATQALDATKQAEERVLLLKVRYCLNKHCFRIYQTQFLKNFTETKFRTYSLPKGTNFI